MKKLLLALLLLPALAFGQGYQNPTFAFTGLLASIPATCRVGALAFITNATAGTNIYECAATNTWTQQGASTATVATTGATVATATNASYFPLLAASATNSNQAFNLDASGLTYNPSTNVLTAGNFVGTFAGNTLTTGSSTYTGTAGQTYTFPTTSATIARTDAANTFTGVQTFTTPVINGLSTGTGVATANTVSTLVARDGSGNFSAGTVTAALAGNATTATTATNQSGGTVAATTIAGTTGTFTDAVSISKAFGGSSGLTINGLTNSNASVSLVSTTTNGFGANFLLSSKTTGGVTNQWTVGTGATGGTNDFEFYDGTATRLAVAVGGPVKVTGTMTVSAIASSGAAQSGYLCYNTSGGVITYDGGATCLISREEYKEDYGPIEGALQTVMDLRPYWGSYKQDSPMGDKRVQAFLGARKTGSIDMRLVSVDKDGEPLGVRENIAVLVAAIQELTSKVYTQAKRIAQLESAPVAANDSFYLRMAGALE